MLPQQAYLWEKNNIQLSAYEAGSWRVFPVVEELMGSNHIHMVNVNWKNKRKIFLFNFE